MKRMKAATLLVILLMTGMEQPAQAGFLRDLGNAISKPFRSARNWLGRQIYKGSGLKNVVDGLEQAGNRLVGKAGQEARQVIKEAKNEIQALINDFDKKADRRLQQANQLVDKLNRVIQRRLKQVEGIANRIIDKVDHKVKMRLLELRAMQTQLNRDAKARLKQLDDIIKARIDGAEQAVKRTVIRTGTELNQVIGGLQQLVRLMQQSISNATNRGGLEGAKMLAHIRYNLINLYTEAKAKGWWASKLGNLVLKVKRGRPTVVRTFPGSGYFNQRKPFQRGFLVVQDLPPGYSMAGKVEAFLKRKKDSKVFPLRTISPEQVLAIVSLKEGQTLAPGHYSLHLKLFRTKRKKLLLAQKEQPAAVEILQEGAGFFALSYTIRHKGQLYRSKRPIVLKQFHSAKTVATLPFPISDLNAARVTVTLKHTVDGRGDAKDGSGSQTISFLRWGKNVHFRLRHQQTSCFATGVTEKLTRVRKLFQQLNHAVASGVKLGRCQAKLYSHLTNHKKLEQILGQVGYGGARQISYTTYLRQRKVGVVLHHMSND